MNQSIERVKEIVAEMSTGDLLGASFTVGECSLTGRPKISCGLTAPDTRAAGLHVQAGIKAGGLGWPPRTVVLESHDPSEQEVVAAAKEAYGLALLHERDENLKFRGVLVTDPHPEARI